MKKRFFLLSLISLVTMTAMAKFMEYDKTHVMYCDEKSHLVYMLNLETQQATIGSGVPADNHNALYFPPIGDPGWNNPVNFWADVEVASSIPFNGTTYTVTAVAYNAFYKTTDVKTVKLPSTIKSIDANAFNHCINLVSINLPEGLEFISREAFCCCKSLTNLHLPSTVQSIGVQAFIGCEKLETINIPSQCSFIGNDAFSWCISLANLRFDDGIGDLTLGYAFEFGPSWEPHLSPLYYPERFFRGLFNDCPLKNLYIGRSLKYERILDIKTPFERCIHKGTDNLGYSLIQRTGKYYSTLEFGDNVTTIPDGIFADGSVPFFKLPKNVKTIGTKAFYRFLDQKTLEIPASCTFIGDQAFDVGSNNAQLKEVVCLGTTPPELGVEALGNISLVCATVPSGCRATYANSPFWSKFFIIDPADKLVTIDLKIANSLAGRLTYEDLHPSNVFRLKLTGPMGTQDWRTLSSLSKLYSLDLSEVSLEDLSPISNLANKLVTFKFPKNLKSVPQNLFYKSHLKGEIILPETCTRIGENAFKFSPFSKLVVKGPAIFETGSVAECPLLSEVSISGKASIMSNSFANNKALKTVKFVDTERIYSEAFAFCPEVTEITFGGQNGVIEKQSFPNSTKITSLTFDGSVREFNKEAFPVILLSRLNINNIDAWMSMSFAQSFNNPIDFSSKVYFNGSDELNLIVPEATKTIGDNIFANCQSLKKLVVTGKNTKIGKGSFLNCKNLVEVELADQLSNIGTSAFEGCTSLTKVNIPSKLHVLPDGLFQGCEALTNIEFPSRLYKIGQTSFLGCTSLKEVKIPYTCETIGNGAFSGCNQLSSFTFSPNVKYLGISAFSGCTSLTGLTLPHRLNDIGNDAFGGCSNLTHINALWENPPLISVETFSGVNHRCVLSVPVSTINSYYENGWGGIPVVSEDYCVAYLGNNEHATVTYGGKEYVKYDNAIVIPPHSDATFEVCPEDNYYISSMTLDGQPIQQNMHSTTIDLTGVETNRKFHFDYGQFYLGDVNDDNYVNVGDISAIVSHIQHQPTEAFIARAADINRDESIDVGDIRGEVNLIQNEAFHSSMTHIKGLSNFSGRDTQLSYSYQVLGNEILLQLHLDNEENLSGFQIVFELPEGLSLSHIGNIRNSLIFDGLRTAQMDIQSIVPLDENRYQILCASTKPTVIKKGEGTILNLKLVFDEYSQNASYRLDLSDIRIADCNGDVCCTSLSMTLDKNNLTGINATNTNRVLGDSKFVKGGQVFIKGKNGVYNTQGIKQNK